MNTNRFATVAQVLRAYLQLIYFDFLLSRRGFTVVHKKVRGFPVGNQTLTPDAEAATCRAVDIACICYWKQVLCLQRSAATAGLLRKHGVPAVLALGAQLLPFKAHAWVEVEGRVVNDKPYVSEIYAVLERC